MNGLMLLADTTVSTVGASDIASILETITAQINLPSILGVLVMGLGVALGLGFMWWGGRKLLSVIMAAFKKGKVNV